MDGYPLNLILAVATASATILLGFLPTRDIRADFFAREALKAAIAWIFVAMSCPPTIIHYPLLIAILCAGSWWQFRRSNLLSGKMWLSIASGLGISIGVMLILAVTPRANPPGLPQLNETLLLASIYLGGAIIGLAYISYILTQNISNNSGVTYALVQRYVGLLFFIAILRAAAVLGTFFTISGHYVSKTIWHNADNPVVNTNAGTTDIAFPIYTTESHLSSTSLAVLILAVFVLPILAFLAQRATRLSSRLLPTRPLVALILLGFLTEILVRLLVL